MAPFDLTLDFNDASFKEDDVDVSNPKKSFSGGNRGF